MDVGGDKSSVRKTSGSKIKIKIKPYGHGQKKALIDDEEQGVTHARDGQEKLNVEVLEIPSSVGGENIPPSTEAPKITVDVLNDTLEGDKDDQTLTESNIKDSEGGKRKREKVESSNKITTEEKWKWSSKRIAEGLNLVLSLLKENNATSSNPIWRKDLKDKAKAVNKLKGKGFLDFILKEIIEVSPNEQDEVFRDFTVCETKRKQYRYWYDSIQVPLDSTNRLKADIKKELIILKDEIVSHTSKLIEQAATKEDIDTLKKEMLSTFEEVLKQVQNLALDKRPEPHKDKEPELQEEKKDKEAKD